MKRRAVLHHRKKHTSAQKTLVPVEAMTPARLHSAIGAGLARGGNFDKLVKQPRYRG